MSPSGANAQLDGSPLDAAVYALLSASAIGVLILRGKRTRSFLGANWPVLAYFTYCLVSVSWSYHPDISGKRWIKAIGDLAMVLVIVTEPRLRDALYRIYSRVGFLLFPTSVLFIKYYGDLGRGYTPDGEPMNTGVSTNKNMLGVMLLVVSLGTVWHILTLLRAKDQPNRGRHLLAQGILLAFGIVLLGMADSATSTACFALGSGLMVATRLRAVRLRPTRVHVLCLAIVISGAAAFLLGGEGGVAHALGRKSNLSGRTIIWNAVLGAAGSPVFGTGFESFWISPNAKIFQRTLLDIGWWHPEGLNEAHDGYIEVYLNLGWVGVCLISLILISGYRRASQAFKRDPDLSSLMLAYIICTAVYSITEAGFRMLDPIWIFLLLAVVCSSGIAAGHFRNRACTGSVSGDMVVMARTSGRLISRKEKSYAHAD
jgi:O-antigen ligase